VYWRIDGAVSINNYSVFKGTIICNNGALGAINTGVVFEGRSLTTNGALSTAAITAIVPDLPSNCSTTGTLVTSMSRHEIQAGIAVYPNPFAGSITIDVNSGQENDLEVKLFSVLGKEVINRSLSKYTTTIETADLPSGVYFYKILAFGKIIQSGKLICGD